MADTPAAPDSKSAAPSKVASFLELVGAAVIVGGLGAAAAIGGVTFGSSDILSHDQAARLMARVFEGSLYVEAGAVGAIAIATLAAGRFKRFLLVAALGGALVGGHWKLAGDMRAIRTAHGGSLSALAKDHPDRLEFGKLHGIYNALALGLLVVGLGVLGANARSDA